MKRSPMKASRPAMTPLRLSAKDEQCTLNVASVCNYDPSTVALCHLPFIGGAGGGQKTDDYCAAYGCSACHDWIDNRDGVHPLAERLYYGARGMIRTLRRMIQKGLITVKGLSPGVDA
jgi:hypothetical protein